MRRSRGSHPGDRCLPSPETASGGLGRTPRKHRLRPSKPLRNPVAARPERPGSAARAKSASEVANSLILGLERAVWPSEHRLPPTRMRPNTGPGDPPSPRRGRPKPFSPTSTPLERAASAVPAAPPATARHSTKTCSSPSRRLRSWLYERPRLDLWNPVRSSSPIPFPKGAKKCQY